MEDILFASCACLGLTGLVTLLAWCTKEFILGGHE